LFYGNVINSKDFTKDIIYEKNEELENNNKIFLKKSKEEEKKNEEKVFHNKSEEFKNSKKGHNKEINILPVKKNINSMTTRQKLLSTKGRNNKNLYKLKIVYGANELNLNEIKEIFHLKSKGANTG